MASLGSFGDIDFYCKSINGKAKILSFYDLQRNSTANYAEHERNGEKSYLEFTGDGLDELTLGIVADAKYGIKPLDVQSKLYAKKGAGTAETFVVGGNRIGDNPYVITSITETYKALHADGRPIKIEFEVTLKEYANKPAIISTIPPARKIGSGTKTAAVTSSDTYTVVKGDCLWKIAKSKYGSRSQYTKIYNTNKDKTKNPNLIYPGQVLIIPK